MSDAQKVKEYLMLAIDSFESRKSVYYLCIPDFIEQHYRFMEPAYSRNAIGDDRTHVLGEPGFEAIGGIDLLASVLGQSVRTQEFREQWGEVVRRFKSNQQSSADMDFIRSIGRMYD
jgi:hypothetical protein